VKCHAAVDVYFRVGGEEGSGFNTSTLKLPEPLLFTGNTKVSVALGNAGDSSGGIEPLRKVTQVPPLSGAKTLNPPFPLPDDAWLVETKKVCQSRASECLECTTPKGTEVE
jgi:hypothetical protein